MLRIFGSLILLGFIVGFRPFGTRWNITPDRPTVWIKFCDWKFEFDNADFPAGDPLMGNTKKDIKTILQSVVDDYNNIPHSFLRVALYPEDPDNPPAPGEGDTPFTKDAASEHSVDACIEGVGATSGAAAGTAQLKSSGKTITGCEIKLGKDMKAKARTFVDTFTHELGHCMGLDHPQEGTHAIMSYYTTGIRLQDDDKMGISYLYPDPITYAGSKYIERHTFGFSCSPR